MHYKDILQTISKALRSGQKVRAIVCAPYSREITDSVKKAFDSSCLSEVVFIGEPERIPVEESYYTLIAEKGPDRIAAVASDKAGEPHSILIKGNISSNVLLKAALKGGEPGGIASHLYIINSVAFPDRAILSTDSGVNIKPDVSAKVKIIHNALEVASAVGYVKTNVALLSATESVSPSIPSTRDAAEIVAMAKQGFFDGAHVDGPMALDAALLKVSAKTKNLDGPVAGNADLLVLDDIEAANSTSKALIGADGDAMGVICGARVPIAFPSRGDSALTRYNSLLLAAFLAQRA